MIKKKGYSVKEVATLMGITKKNVYDDIRAGKLKCVEVGQGKRKKYIITQPDLEQRFGKDRIRAMLKENGV